MAMFKSESDTQSDSEDVHPFDADAVEKPNDRDILCGRGGFTNTHPGNAWYRNLVRANRPYYRSSPKHGKILIAKTIVDHVFSQNPPCRFLEKSRVDGNWYRINKKRSVDKTSQALRERERLNGDDDCEVDTEALAKQMILLKNARSNGVSAVMPKLILPPQPDYGKTEVRRQSDKTFVLVSDKGELKDDPNKKRKMEAMTSSKRDASTTVSRVASNVPILPTPCLSINCTDTAATRNDPNNPVESAVARVSARFWHNSTKAATSTTRGMSSRSLVAVRAKRRSLPLSATAKTNIVAAQTMGMTEGTAECNTCVKSPGVELLSYLKNSQSTTGIIQPNNDASPSHCPLPSSSPAAQEKYESTENNCSTVREDDVVASTDDQFADPDDDQDPSPILMSLRNKKSAQRDAGMLPLNLTIGHNGYSAAMMEPGAQILPDVGAQCRVCKVARFSPADVPERYAADTNPELVWSHTKAKSYIAVNAVLEHCLEKHPHWPVWNTLSNLQHSFPSAPRGVNVFHRALAMAANVSPHRLGDTYNSIDEMNFRVAERIGRAKGYVEWGPWEFNNQRALQILASSMLLDYGTIVKMSVCHKWDKISSMSHQERVDLFNNIFLVPYCIDQLREKGGFIKVS